MSPNRIYHLFVIPPFNDTFVVLKLLKKLLIYWSDRTEPIKTFEVLPDQVHLFARAGFWPDEFRCRWMQRPTDHFEVEWNEEFRIESPQIEDDGKGAKRFILEDQIAECSYASFNGSLEATRRKNSLMKILFQVKNRIILMKHYLPRQRLCMIGNRDS